MIHVKKIPKKDIVFVHSKMTSKEITRRLSKFHVDPESPTPIGEQHTAKYIVGMSSVIATGLTLAEGIAVASLEPDFHVEMIA